MASHRTKELVLLILQFLEEEGYHAAARSLEMDSGFYFDMDYFEVLVLHGHWDEADKYLSGFTKYDDNRFSTKIYFEMRKQNYIEALDKHDHAKALQILNRDLKVFASYKEELFKEMTQLLTLDNIRQNESLASYVDVKSARKIMVKELKKLIKANPLFKGKLKLPKMKMQRLRCLVNQGLNWQLKHLRSKNPHDQIKTAFVDHACQSLTDLLSDSAENSFEELSTSMEVEDLLYGWPCLPTAQTSSCEGDDVNDAADLGDGGKDMKSNEVVTENTESAQPDQREVTDLPKQVIWTFTEDSSPTSIDFHPTKPYDLLVGMGNGDIGLWDVYWRKKLQSINFKVWNVGACSMAFTAAMLEDPHMSINRIAWSPDGSLFGAAYSKHMVQLFHYLRDDTIQQHIEIDAHIGAVNDLAFLVPNQQLVLITCGDDLKIKVWDAATGANISSVEGHTAPIYSICPYTKEGDHFIFSTSLDGNLKVWMSDGFEVRGDYDAPVHGCTTMAYSTDGKRVFSCGINADGESFLVEWEFNEGAIKRLYKGLLGQDCLDAVRLDISKNKYLAVGDDHKIKFWDMDSTELLTTTDAAGNLPARPCICFNSEGTLLAVTAKEKEIKILATDCPADFITLPNIDGSEEVRAFLGFQEIIDVLSGFECRTGPCEFVDFHEDVKIDDSSYVRDSSPKHASASGESEIFNSCHADSATRCVSLKIPSSLKSGKISRLIYTNAGDAIVALVAPTFVHTLWKWPKKATAKTSPILNWGAQLMRNQPSNIPPCEVFPCFALTKNDSYLLSASGGMISLFDIVNLRVKAILSFSETPPVATCIAFHPQDSNVIAIGRDDSTILIYHIRLNKVKAKLVGHSGRVTGLAFSDSLNVLVSSGKDAQIFVWDVEGWKMQRRISLHSHQVELPIEESDTYVQFHRDQMHFLVVSKTHIALYNAKNPEYIEQWIPAVEISLSESQWNAIIHATFSCDSKRVYAIFFNGSIMVLDALELKIRYTIDRKAYLPEAMSCDVYPTAIAAHPQIPAQFAVGLVNGEVFVVEPAEEDECQ